MSHYGFNMLTVLNVVIIKWKTEYIRHRRVKGARVNAAWSDWPRSRCPEGIHLLGRGLSGRSSRSPRPGNDPRCVSSGTVWAGILTRGPATKKWEFTIQERSLNYKEGVIGIWWDYFKNISRRLLFMKDSEKLPNEEREQISNVHSQTH